MHLIYDMIYQKYFLQPLWIMPFVKNKAHPFVDSDDIDCIEPKSCTFSPGRKSCIFQVRSQVLAGVSMLSALLHHRTPSQVKAKAFWLQF